MLEITLMRHGKPDVAIPRLLASWQLRGFIDRYDAAGIGDQPPPEATALARQCPLLVSSDLPRARQTAQALRDGAPDLEDAIFREAAIPYFRRLPLVLPPHLWLPLLRGLWWLGYSGNGEHIRQSRERGGLAAERLIGLAQKHQRLLLVGHGFHNHFIARERLRQGWSGPARPGHQHWQHTVYCYPE